MVPITSLSFWDTRIITVKMLKLNMIILMFLSTSLAMSPGMEQTYFKRIMFSDSIWDEHYSKQEFHLAAGENGAVECGTMCSMRGDNCVLFQYDPIDGRCTLAKVK